MSEFSLLIHCTFDDAKTRDAVRTFLNRSDGPVSEDQVDEPFKDAFLALEDVEWADEVESLRKTALSIYYDVLPMEDDLPEDLSRKIMTALHKAGAYKITACFADDEEYEVYWGYDGDTFKTLYTVEDDEDLDEELMDLEPDEALELITKKFYK